MAALKPTTIRQRMAAGLAARANWVESPYVYDLFGREPKTLVHLSFAVGVKDTINHPDARRQKRRSGEPQLVITDVEVVFGYRFHIDDQNTSFDGALDEESSAIKTALAISRTDLHLTWTGTRREIVGNFINVRMSFQAIHQIDLI